MTRLMLGLVAATSLSLLGGDARAQVNPLRYNNPLAQGNMYANDPVLRYNNPLAQGNMYGNPAAPFTGPQFRPGTSSGGGNAGTFNNGFVGAGSYGVTNFNAGVNPYVGFGQNPYAGFGQNNGYGYGYGTVVPFQNFNTGAGFGNGFNGGLAMPTPQPMMNVPPRSNTSVNNMLNGNGSRNNQAPRRASGRRR